jgi:hypothetical protein
MARFCNPGTVRGCGKTLFASGDDELNARRAKQLAEKVKIVGGIEEKHRSGVIRVAEKLDLHSEITN